jgi:hypothetical protein
VLFHKGIHARLGASARNGLVLAGRAIPSRRLLPARLSTTASICPANSPSWNAFSVARRAKNIEAATMQSEIVFVLLQMERAMRRANVISGNNTRGSLEPSLVFGARQGP